MGEVIIMLNNRRWYDSNEHTEKALELLKDMDENKRRALAKDLTTFVKQVKEMRDDNDENDVSIGIDRVFGLYKISNSRRWYDKVSILSYALKTMSTLPKEDFYNIMVHLCMLYELYRFLLLDFLCSRFVRLHKQHLFRLKDLKVGRMEVNFVKEYLF